MTEKKFCIYATTAVGTIGGIILAPAIGPLALGLPLLMGLFGKTMANATGLDDTEREIRYREKSKSNKFDYVPSSFLFKEARSPGINDLRIRSSLPDFVRVSRRDEPRLFMQVRTENKTVRRNQGGIKGARGIPDNEAYLRRHGRR
jgi:hypothetical protein